MLTVLVHSAGYLLRGHMSFRPILLIFPITGMLFLRNNMQRPLRVKNISQWIFASLLAILSVVGFFMHYQEASRYDVEPGAQWLLQHNPSEDAVLLSDLNTTNKFLLEEVESGHWINIKLHNTESYRFLVKGRQGLSNPSEPINPYVADYVVVNIDRLQQPILVGGWLLYEPLANYFPLILENSSLNLIYNEGRYIIFRVDSPNDENRPSQ